MVTPTKDKIVARAKELYFSDQYKNGSRSSINPTESELKESGYVSLAMSELMQSEGKAYEDFLEESKDRYTQPTDLEIDSSEILRSGCFISGGKGTGKSNLAKIIVDKLLKQGYIVKAFDISRTWLDSSVPQYCEVRSLSDSFNVNHYQNVVYDLSTLLLKDIKKFIAQTLAREWELQINIPKAQRRSIIYVLEESQMLVPQGQLRSAQVVLRLLSSGRNFDLGYVAIAQRPATVDTSVFELSGVRYFGRMDGQNDIKKVSHYVGQENAKKLQDLEVGDFLFDYGSKTTHVKIDLFKLDSKPKKIEPRKIEVPNIEQAKDYRGAAVVVNSILCLLVVLLGVINH